MHRQPTHLSVLLWLLCAHTLADLPMCKEGYNAWNNDVVEHWTGSNRKQSYSYLIQNNNTITFTWTFQRTEELNKAHTACLSECTLDVQTRDGTKLHYDFTPLANATGFHSSPRFTSKGLRYFHRFNVALCGKRLQYKYSKLMMSSGGKECELPTADSCAIMEGEDAEDDLIDLTKKSFLTKIKSFSRE
ncbi:unnamed protein product, partial [Lampetra planeri]